MLLALDIGNTNVTMGVFDGDRLRATWRFATDVEKLADEYAVLILSMLGHEGIAAADINEAVIACVVPDLDPLFQLLCGRYFGVKALSVHAGVRTGLRILYDTPRDVGADRVADAVAAIHLHGPPPLIVVDLGTATVFDAVNKDGDYLGGALAPGVGIAAEALYRRAAKLYRVELTRPRSAIGRNTVAAMQSGILFGYVGLIEGIVRRMKDELGGEARVIGTGGFAPVVGRETSIIDVIDPNLTLEGLRIIHGLNRG